MIVRIAIVLKPENQNNKQLVKSFRKIFKITFLLIYFFQVYILCGIYIALALSACCLLTFFLDSYKKIGIEKIIPKKSSISMLVNTLKHIRNKKQILVIPITLFSGFEQAFISADFTKVNNFIFIIVGSNFKYYFLSSLLSPVFLA